MPYRESLMKVERSFASLLPSINLACGFCSILDGTLNDNRVFHGEAFVFRLSYSEKTLNCNEFC